MHDAAVRRQQQHPVLEPFERAVERSGGLVCDAEPPHDVEGLLNVRQQPPEQSDLVGVRVALGRRALDPDQDQLLGCIGDHAADEVAHVVVGQELHVERVGEDRGLVDEQPLVERAACRLASGERNSAAYRGVVFDIGVDRGEVEGMHLRMSEAGALHHLERAALAAHQRGDRL